MPAPTPSGDRSRAWAHPAVAAGAFAFSARVVLVALVPDNYSFDGYQRWAGRDHLLVQDWLPASQAVIWAVHHLGGGIVAARIALALVAAMAAASGAAVAGRLGGRAAAWLFAPIAVFPPFFAWSAVFYQEGTWLALLLGAFALALRGRERGSRGLLAAADLLAGGAALARYEGWVFVAFYLVWRRDWRAALASWGPLVWVVLRFGLGLRGHAASPTDFADWEGIGDRFTPGMFTAGLARAAAQYWDTGALALLLLAVAGASASIRARRDGAGAYALFVLAQLAIVLAWMVGLETSTYRMQAGVTPLLGVLAAAAAGTAWEHWQRLWVRGALVAAAVASTPWFAWRGYENARVSVNSVRVERDLVRRMKACAGCRFTVSPRRRLGTRDRHDGCEVIQGMSEMLAGRDFACETWPGDPGPHPTHRAVWKSGGYRVTEVP